MILPFVFAFALSAKAKDFDLNLLKRRVSAAKKEVALLQDDIKKATENISAAKLELETAQFRFRRDFNRIMIPLLHWPQTMSEPSAGSFIERQHLQLIVTQTRNRVVKRPLQDIEARDAKVKELEALETSLEERRSSLLHRQEILTLQQQELQTLLKKKNRKKAL